MPKLFNDNITITDNGNVINNDYNDIYFRVNKAIDESLYTYVKPANLKDIQPKIIEIGFGCGLNFILSKIENNNKPMEYHAIEKHPISPKNILKVYKNLGLYQKNQLFIEDFIKCYEKLNYGKNEFQIQNVKLTLYIGDAVEMVNKIDKNYNVIYYDGFSPSKNIDVWEKNIFEKLYQSSNHDCKLLSFSASSIVKKNLLETGYCVKIVPGYMGKRESIIATPVKVRKIDNIKTVNIIGAGIVGSTLAHFFANCGINVVVYDMHEKPFSENSKNPINLLKLKSKLAKDYIYDFGVKSFIFANEYINTNFNDAWVKKNVTHYKHKSNEDFSTMVGDEKIGKFLQDFDDKIIINSGGSICTKTISKLIYDNNKITYIQKKFDTLKQILQLNSDYTFLCLGSNQDIIYPFHENNVKIFGHCMKINYDNNFENINAQSYIAPINNKQIIVGSSFIRNENHNFTQKDDQKILRKLKTHINNNYKVEKKYFGTRVNFSNNLPQIHKICDNVVTINGMGSRGFTNSFIICDTIKNILTNNVKNIKLSKKIIGEIGFHKL